MGSTLPFVERRFEIVWRVAFANWTCGGVFALRATPQTVSAEAPFFNTDPLQSSPECLGQAGVVAVTVGTSFTSMSGILDVDPYAAAQALSPVLPSDYTLAP